MTNHSINTHIVVSSSLAFHCYSMLMLMTSWWPFALIQMTSSDILGLGSRQEAVGMLWHILSLASSSADGLSWTCCVISQASYRNQTWRNTICLQQTIRAYINRLQLHLSFCHDFWRSGSKFGYKKRKKKIGPHFVWALIGLLFSVCFNHTFTILCTDLMYIVAW